MRELDRKVAQTVGWKDIRARAPLGTLIGIPPGDKIESCYSCKVPRYSTDIAAAWELVEEMLAEKHTAFQAEAHYGTNGNYEAGYRFTDKRSDNMFFGGNSMAEAICNAYLAWKERG